MRLSELNDNKLEIGNMFRAELRLSLWYRLAVRLGYRLGYRLSDSLWLYFDVHLHDWITHKLAEVYDEAE